MVVVIGLAWFAALVYVNAKWLQARNWHAYRGERAARAEYARLLRERPDAPEIQVSEAEFTETFVASRPRPWRYAIATVVLVVVGVPGLGLVAVAFR